MDLFFVKSGNDDLLWTFRLFHLFAFQKSKEQQKPLHCAMCCHSFRRSRVVDFSCTCLRLKVNAESSCRAAFPCRPGLDVVWMIYRMLLVLNEWPNFFLFEPWWLQITELQLGDVGDEEWKPSVKRESHTCKFLFAVSCCGINTSSGSFLCAQTSGHIVICQFTHLYYHYIFFKY